MARNVNFVKKLRKIAAGLEELATALESMPVGNGMSGRSKPRRSKKEVAALKKLLKAERKAGVPVAELAAKHGVSGAYIYMLR